MSKLRPYLADIASAIREKKGSSEPINAKDFSNEIRNIQSGAVELERNDVNFYDYDGTLLFAYTLAETQALTELPTPKGHEGLVFEGWNWDYEDVIALDYPMDIGAMYITDDGKTRFYLEVEDEEGVDIELGFTQTANDVVVDFGDGSPTQTSADAKAIIPHHYAKGSYVLMMWSQGNKKYTFEQSNETRNCLGLISRGAAAVLRKIEFGENEDESSFAFQRCINLEVVSSPRKTRMTWTKTYENCLKLKHFNYYGDRVFIYSFVNCTSLRHLVLPKKTEISATSFTKCAFQNIRFGNDNIITAGPSYSDITELYIPKGITTLPNQMARGCLKLKKVTIDSDITSLPDTGFSECHSLMEINIPQSVVEIKNSAFNYTSNLLQLVFPPNLTTIGNSAFFYSGCYKYDFSACLQIPTLGNVSAFQYTPATSKIIVPDALYDDWKAATNWSTYADRIVKASEYNG